MQAMHSRAPVPSPPVARPAVPWRAQLGPRAQVLVFVAVFLVISYRRPGTIFGAQFWAEDGTVFYANAYNAGLRSLAMAYGGYLNAVSQLAGLLALSVPLWAAPLLMNVCAIIIQALPVNLFLSARFAAIPMWLRALAALVYVAIPNVYEVHANITNVQWTLALLALLVLLADPPRVRGWRVFDAVVLVLLSLDGPLGMLLAPFAMLLAWRRGEAWPQWRVLALLPGSCVQALVVLSHSRAIGPTGASVPRLIAILARQVFAPSLVGLVTVRQHLQWLQFPWEIAIVGVALALMGYALARGPLQMKIVILFSGTVLAAALARPLVTLTRPQWELIAIAPGAANRYYFLPEIAFLAALAWIAASTRPARPLRVAAIVLLAALPYGMARDWRYPAFADLHFRDQARRFENAPRGASVTIPINPPGWTMQLVKR